MTFPTKYPKEVRDYVRNNVLTKTNAEIRDHVKTVFGINYPSSTLCVIRSFKSGKRKSKFGTLLRPVGTERIDKNGVVFVLCEDGKEHPKHRILWEKERGKLEKDDVLIFLDGDRRNIAIDNLFCVKKKYSYVLSKMLKGLDPTPEMRKTAIYSAMLLVEANDKERLKTKKSPYSFTRKNTYKIVCEMINEGLSVREISEKLGLSPSTIGLYKIKKRLGYYEDQNGNFEERKRPPR